jgi:predicted neuraminidase
VKSTAATWIGIVLTLGLHGAVLLRRDVAPSGTGFLMPDAPMPTKTVAAPWFAEEFVDPTMATPSVHVASLAELPGGRLAATWYGGTREGARDVAIFFATRDPGTNQPWSRPRVVVTADSAARELDRYVRKVGNAVIFSGSNGRLHLLFVSIAVGGWSGSSLNWKSSSDGGATWERARRLTLSPWFNVSELVKNRPAPLARGGWAVPIYHEAAGKFPELLWFDPRDYGVVYAKSRVFGGRNAFQQTLVPLDFDRALMFCRDRTPARRVRVTQSTDGGKSWSDPTPLDLPNPDSGLDALRLADGRLLLAFNDSEASRDNLRLALSADEGRTWSRAATLAEEKGAEFSYPFLLQSSDHSIHVAYTWKRRAIRHVMFSAAWLNARRNDASP